MVNLDVSTLAELVERRTEFETEYAGRLTTLLHDSFVSKMVPHLTRLDVSMEETKNNFLNDIPKILFSTRRKKPLDVKRFLSNMERKLGKLVKEHPKKVLVQVTFGDEIYCETVLNNPLVNVHFTLKESVTYGVNGPGWLKQVLKTATKKYAKDGEVFVTDHAGQRYDSDSLTTPPLSTNPVPLSLTVVSRQTVDRTKDMYRSLNKILKYSQLVANKPPLFWKELANTLTLELPPSAEKCIQKVKGVEAFTKNIGFGYPVREMTPPNLQLLHSNLEWLNAVHESFRKLKHPSTLAERQRVVGELILRTLGGDDENDVEKPPKKVRTSE